MGFNTLKTFLMLTAMTVLFVLIGRAIGGQSGMVIALCLAVAMNFFSYWFSDKIVLKMYKASEVTEATSPRLYGIVRKLIAKAGMPMPRVYIIPSGTPNAFATGRNQKHAAVAVTNTLMDMLTDEELEGVIAHEISHIYGRDILIGSIAATFAGAIMLLTDIFKWGMILGGGNRDGENSSPISGIMGIAMIILAPLAAMMIQMAISRSREYVADERGGALCGNPRALASALNKISYGVSKHEMTEARPATAHMFIMNPFTHGGMLSLFSTHPPVEKRIEKLEAQSRSRTSRFHA